MCHESLNPEASFITSKGQYLAECRNSIHGRFHKSERNRGLLLDQISEGRHTDNTSSEAFSDVTPIHNLKYQSNISVTPILSTPTDNLNNLNVSIAVWSNPKSNLKRTCYSLKSVSL
jgi:hypothetical protein